MNIKKIVVFIVFCGFSASLASSPVPHIVVHKPKPPLVGIPAYIKKAARISGLPTKLIAAVIHVESHGKVNAVSSAGAVGLMQLTKNTAKMLHVNPWNPKQNIVGGARYLARLIKRFGGLWLGLEAYNTGPTNVAEGRVCPSAVIYATNVVRRMSEES
jgi:soluble lytic murein transglycosylase-like protein